MRIFDGRQWIDSDWKSGYTISKVNARISIYESHLSLFVIILIVHIVDDVHGLVIYTGDLYQYLFIVGHYFFELQRFACQYRDVFYHDSACVFATSSVDCQQQCFCKVGTGAEELNLLSDFLVRNTTSDTVIVRLADLTHQVIVFVLYGWSIDGYLCTECLETFRQFRTP